MTSLELVDYINQLRLLETGIPELRHDNFMQKVTTVLGEAALHFKDCLPDRTGKAQPLYRFPKREATLMAMSYSPEISAQVFLLSLH